MNMEKSSAEELEVVKIVASPQSESPSAAPEERPRMTWRLAFAIIVSVAHIIHLEMVNNVTDRIETDFVYFHRL